MNPSVLLLAGIVLCTNARTLPRHKDDTSATLKADEPYEQLSQKGLRGGNPLDKDLDKELREHYEKVQEKLESIPNHWDLPLIPRQQMTWSMYARVVEKEVLLAVHHGYIAAWWTSIGLLVLVSAAFVGYARSLVAKDSDEYSKPFREIPCGETDDGTKSLVQKGFAYSMAGSSIFWLWVLLPLLGYIQMGLIALDHYFFAIHEPDLTWNQWAQPYLLVFCLSHFTLFLQTQFLARARVVFMLPEPLASATVVLIEDTESTTSDGSLVDVRVSDGIRFFEHTCIRYLWSEQDGLFSPVGSEAGLTGKTAGQRLNQGGLSPAELDARKIIGPNEINVPVPGVGASLAEEFLTPLYVFQFAAIWLYLFIDGWNTAFVWTMWTLAAGVSKSLFVVRRNRLKVQALARTEARATVLRERKWVELPSTEVTVGDVISVDEGVVSCDILIVKGGAVVNESMLTGEPMPVQRFAVEDVDTELVTTASHKKHLLFTGTIVMQSASDAADASTPRDSESSSRSVGVVFNTGAMTMKGTLIRTVLFPEPYRFKFTDQLPRVYLFMFIYVCCLFTIMQVFANTGSWIFQLYIGFTILVQSLNPLLPVSITLAHTVGSEKLMQDEGVHCLSPSRLPIAGKVHVMVMDKTGTITKEGMEFRGAQVAKDSTFVDPPFWAKDGHLETEDLPESIRWALASCHTVTRLRNGTMVGNMVEVAMLNASGWTLSEDSKSVSKPSGEEIKILKQLEFDQKRMTSGSVIAVEGKTVALIKGSYERVAELTTSGVPANFKDVTEGFATEQYYTLGVGMKILASGGEQAPREELEKDIAFVGLLLFRNEMKSDSPDAVLALKEGGTRAVICTGDNALTGAAIGRQCGMIAQDQDIILGDFAKGNFTWTRLSDKAPLPHKQILEARDDDEVGKAELVLTKPAFRELQHTGELLKILNRVRVYARMKPDDKVAVVQTLQEQDFVVGMVGDGGNDCGAMRAAHVGLALSDAEASIVAPFSSSATYGTGEKSLMAVPHLLRYGRATLQTNSGTFLFFMVYGFALPTSKLTQTLMSNAMMAEWNWLFIDLALACLFVLFMTSCRPSEKLAPIRPTAALLEGRTISNVACQMLMFFFFYALGLHVLWQQKFHVGYDTAVINIPAHEWPKKGDNFDCAVTFLVLANQILTAGFCGCLGAEHRKNVLKDLGVTLGYVFIMLIFIALILGGPSDFHCVFRVNCDNRASRTMSGWTGALQHFSAGNIGGCFLGPQLQGWKEELGDRWQFPDEASNQCFPAKGFDPEAKLSVPSEAFFGMGADTCYGPNNCFSSEFRIIFTALMLLQSGLSIVCNKMLLSYHPATKQHFKRL